MLWILEQIDTLEPEAVLSLLPTITEARRVRVLAMNHVPTQIRAVLAELLLRFALREELGLTELPRIEIGEKGKPFFPDRPEICFNLSHCKTAVACALDDSPVGVDVQEVRSVRREGKRSSAPPLYRILSQPERTWVEAGETPWEQDRRFTAVWTCKEAWGKATGVGVLYDLRSTEFRPKKRPWKQYGRTFRQLDEKDTFLTLCAARSLRLRRIDPARLLSGFTEVIS